MTRLPAPGDATPPAPAADPPPAAEPGGTPVEVSAAAPAETPAAAAPAETGARLAELFPALFGGAVRPLKLRIQNDIQQRAPGVFTRKALSAFLHRYTTGNAYLKALVRAAERVDLDGAAAGAVSDEHRQAAAEELERRRRRLDEKIAAERAARRDADEQRRRTADAGRRQARAADEEARRARAQLLHAYETTTLARANFCALKRLDEATLDALLAQARQERSERSLDARRSSATPPRAGTERGDRPPRGAPGRPPPRDRNDRRRGAAAPRQTPPHQGLQRARSGAAAEPAPPSDPIADSGRDSG